MSQIGPGSVGVGVGLVAPPTSSLRTWRDLGIRSRLSFALEEEGGQKDVIFILGDDGDPQIISAHRLILSLSSAHFDKLLKEGAGAADGLMMIRLPRVCPKMFKKLLTFIYTDEVETENFLAFLDFAESFGFNHLHEICLESWTRTGITVENVIFILGLENRRLERRKGDCADDDGADVEAEVDSSPGLRENCLQFIRRNGDRVLELDAFNEISQQDLGCILESDDLIMEGGEFSVFLAVLRWAKYRCKLGGFVDGETPGNLKFVLGHVRWSIRYTLIPTADLFREVKTSGLLTSAEFILVLKTFMDPTENPLGISTHLRNTPLLEGVINENETSEPEPKRRRRMEEVEAAILSINPLPSSSTALLPPVAVPEAEEDPEPDPPGTTPTNDFMTPVPSSLEMTEPISPPRLRIVDPATIIEPEVRPVSTPHPPIVVDLIDDIDMTPSTSAAFPPDLAASCTEFLLSDTVVDWGYLIMAVEQKRSTLTRIILKNTSVLVFNHEHGSRVFIPNLDTFHYSLDQGKAQKNTCKPDESHPYFVDTKGFLFFEKGSTFRSHLDFPWTYSDLPILGVDIQISVKGIHLMVISPSENKIILSYPPSKVGDMILDNCPQDTRILSLFHTEIKCLKRFPTNHLEQLTLYNVQINDLKMSSARFLNKCSALRYLSYYEIPSQVGKMKKDYPTVSLFEQLKKCRTTLESCSLTRVRIIGVATKCLRFSIPFSAMEQLYLNSCLWTLPFQNHFNLTFPNLKRFGICWEWKDKVGTCSLLRRLLSGHNNLELVSATNQTKREGNNLPPTADEIWIEQFLRNLTPKVSGSTSRGNLEKDLLAQNIILRKIRGNWTRPAGTREEEDAATIQIHFNALRLDQFFEP